MRYWNGWDFLWGCNSHTQPYTNFHTFNFDWIIEEFKTIGISYEALLEIVNGIIDLLPSYATKKEVEELFKTGNFTGTILGYTVACLLVSISDAQRLARVLNADAETHTNLGTIYDCGGYTDSDPIQFIYDGGHYYTWKVA